MSLDQPGSSYALWNIFKETGVRPEFILGVLAYESGLNPAVPNGAGAPYYGIGQNYGPFITQMTGLSPQEYMAKPASYQLQNVVLPYFKGQVDRYGPLTSGVKVYQAEYCPASLQWATGLDDVISSPAQHTECSYSANAGFDTAGKGYITPRDLGHAIASKANSSLVKQAISDAYANAPFGAGSPQDPVFGNSSSGFFSSPKLKTALLAGALVLTASFIASEISPGFFSDSTGNLRRRLRLT